MFDIEGMRMAVGGRRIQWQRHALERMIQRGIRRSDVLQVLTKGELIEEYPLDKPWPSALFLGWVRGSPVHVVAAYHRNLQKTAIITVYEPSLEYFENDFRTRRKRNA